MMDKEENITNWEKDAPLLASLKKDNAFAVPEFYFENLSEQIINQIKLEDNVGKVTSFKTPEDYFETLNLKIAAEILLNERKELLQANHGGFDIPNEYFENSKATIFNKIDEKKSTYGKIFNIKLIKYAAAACILFTTTFGIYFNIQRTNSIDYQLSKVSDDEIENYLKQNIEASDVPIIIENLNNKPVFSLKETELSEADIDAYLKSTL